MKKIIALFLMAFMLVSIVPFSYAEEESGVPTINNEPTIDNTPIVDSEGRAKHSRAAKARERLQIAKKRLADVKLGYKEDKVNFQNKMREFKRFCSNNQDNERCNRLDGELNTNAKKFLLKSIDTMLDILGKRDARLEHMKSKLVIEGDDERVQKIDLMIEEIQNKTQHLEELRERVEGLETNEELREIAKEVKSLWKEIKHSLRLNGGVALVERFEGILVKSHELEDKLGKVLTRAEDNGVDVTLLMTQITSFKEHVALAQNLVGEAREKFNEAKEEPGNSSDLVREGTQLLKEAKKELRLAHGELKEIVKEIKSMGETIEGDMDE